MQKLFPKKIFFNNEKKNDFKMFIEQNRYVFNWNWSYRA